MHLSSIIYFRMHCMHEHESVPDSFQLWSVIINTPRVASGSISPSAVFPATSLCAVDAIKHLWRRLDRDRDHTARWAAESSQSFRAGPHNSCAHVSLVSFSWCHPHFCWCPARAGKQHKAVNTSRHADDDLLRGDSRRSRGSVAAIGSWARTSGCREGDEGFRLKVVSSCERAQVRTHSLPVAQTL